MAFMLMLERLSPADRAVFLLREAFDYDYAEIARLVEKSEASCRQIVSRAKARLGPEASPPAAPPTEQAQRIVRRFLDATASGAIRDLLALLTDDAVLYSDGGGRIAAVGRPILGADRISRFFFGVRRWQPAEVEFRFVRVNGRAGALMLVGGQLVNAYSFDVVGDRVRTIFIVRNPDKLQHVPTL